MKYANQGSAESREEAPPERIGNVPQRIDCKERREAGLEEKEVK